MAAKKAEKCRNQPVSRILSAFRRLRGVGVTTIPLDPRLLADSSDLPGGSDGPSFSAASAAFRRRPQAGAAFRHARATLFGLAPCGVLPATDVAAGAVRSYRTFSPLPDVPGWGPAHHAARELAAPLRCPSCALGNPSCALGKE